MNKKNHNQKRKKDTSKNIIKEEKLEYITGIYSKSKNNDFGFIDVEGKEKGYFVHFKNSFKAFDQDEVKAYIKIFNRRKEAVITEVIKRADRILVGSIQLVKDFGFVILDNKLFKKDIYIPNKEILKFKKDLKNDYKVAVKIKKRDEKNPQGEIIEILGDPKTKAIDILAIAMEGGARIHFPPKAIEEAEKLKFEILSNRQDLTQNLTFTIDGEDAKDLDDAISLEKINSNNYKLIVSIADVSHYVKYSTQLDKEALKRGNSIYLVDRVIPMLPEKISNNLCSLNPNTKKLTLSCEIVLDENAEIISSKVYKSIISSKFRLTYKEVQEIIEQKLKIGDNLMFGGIISQELVENILLSYELKQKISLKKSKTGVLNFDFPETKIILDKNGHPTEIKKYERYESMKIIEEFMILANQVVGELFSKIPFLYRIHPKPNDEDLEKVRNIFNIFNITLPKNITPLSISKILDEINNHKKSKFLQKILLRSLEKAIYSDENIGHFGLGLDFYSHFTSPIRRYSDLQIHRIISDFLEKKLDKNHYKEILDKVAKSTSENEKKAEKLEYAVKDLMICKYYQDKIGQENIGIVSGIIQAGIFVELENTAEGFISIDDLILQKNIKKADFDENQMKFIFSKDFFIQIGDCIKIKVSGVDFDRKKVIFEFLEKK